MVPIFSEEVIATTWQRFFNYIIDMVVQYIAIFGLAMLIGLLVGFFEWDTLLESIAEITPLQEYLFGIFFMLLYYFFSETFLKGRTVGKYATGTMVVDENGEIPTASNILQRTFCRIIPFDALSFFGHRGWHDSISRTYVVKKEAWETSRELQLSFDEIGLPTEEL